MTICFTILLSIFFFILLASLSVVWPVPASLFLCCGQSHHSSGDECRLPWLSYPLLSGMSSPLSIMSAASNLLCSRRGFEKITKEVEDIYTPVSFNFKRCDRSIWVNSAFLVNYHIAAKGIEYFRVYRDASGAFGIKKCENRVSGLAHGDTNLGRSLMCGNLRRTESLVVVVTCRNS